MKQWKLPDLYPDTAGLTFNVEIKGRQYILVTINEEWDNYQNKAFAFLVHESVHVWHAIKNHIGDTTINEEVEAYNIQWIWAGLVESYTKSRLEPKGKDNALHAQWKTGLQTRVCKVPRESGADQESLGTDSSPPQS